jgi:hypothetical protein
MRSPLLPLVALLWACGSSRPAAPPTPLTNVEPPVDAAVVAPEDAPCPNQCMDTCCKAGQICSHGRAGDGTYAKCLRPRP